MKSLLKALLLSTVLSGFICDVVASPGIAIKPSNKTVLLDGYCGNDEWQSATEIALPAQAYIYLMYDEDYLYICAKGKAEDITVLDLYIKGSEGGLPHKYHLSAQMGEKVLSDRGWETTSKEFGFNDYAGFWVPYAGLEDQENRKNPKFSRGTHRQVQISRKKFPGKVLHMMFGVSAIKHNDEWAEFFFPEEAVADEFSTWGTFLYH